MTRIITDNLRIIAEKIAHNRKIEAIKDLRMITNLALKESKDVVDRAERAGGYATKTASIIKAQLYADLLKEGFLFDDLAPATLDPSRGMTEPYNTASSYGYPSHRTQADSLANVMQTMLEDQQKLLKALLEQAVEQTALLKDMMEVLSE